MTDQRKLAVVYHFLPNYRQGIFDALAKAEGWDVTFIAGHDRPGQEGVPEAVGLPSHEVKNRYLAGHFLWQQGLLRELRKTDYDALIILGNWMWVTNWLASIWYRRLLNRPVLFWTHGWIDREPSLQGRLRRLFYRQADKLLLYGHRAAEIGGDYGWDDDDLVVIGNSLPLPADDLVPEPWDGAGLADPDLPVALWIARLIPEKKPEMVIEAVAEAEARGRPVNAVFIGSDPDGVYEQMAEARIPGRAVFTGPVHDEARLAGYFEQTSVTVVPDYGGLSIPHSLIHGVPVVANDDPSANGPDYEYLVAHEGSSDQNGSVFPAGDGRSFCSQIIRWCYDEPVGAEDRARIRSAARSQASPQLGAERVLGAVRACFAR